VKWKKRASGIVNSGIVREMKSLAIKKRSLDSRQDVAPFDQKTIIENAFAILISLSVLYSTCCCSFGSRFLFSEINAQVQVSQYACDGL
jgi:hypothetical protein